jgi:hypothetical protein
MTRIKPGKGWTLLFLRRQGASLALAQVDLYEGWGGEGVLAELLSSMQRRGEDWRLSLQERSPPPELEVWEEPAARRRHLEALALWCGLAQGQGLRQLEAGTLATCCACVWGQGAEVDAARLDGAALLRAARAVLAGQEAPALVAGVSLVAPTGPRC